MGVPTTILFVLMPERSAASATLMLAKRLKDLGYRVLFTGPEQELFDDRVYGVPDLLGPYLAAQGLEYQPLRRTPFTPPGGGSRRWAARAGIRHHRRDMRLMSAQLASMLVDLQPAVMVLDTIIWRYAQEALRLGIPLVNLSTTLTRTYDPAVPPIFSGLSYRSGTGRIRYRLEWAVQLTRARYREQIRPRIWPWSLGLLPVRSTIRRLRRNGARIRWTEYGPRVVAPELVTSPAELDLPEVRDARTTRVYIGACVEPNRRDEAFDWTFVPPGSRVIFCSLGTYSAEYPHAERLFRVVLEAVTRLGCATVIQAHIDPPAGLPDTVRIVRAVPQLEVLSRSEVFITHGGLSSVREACYFGVPMVVFPGWNDQPGNGARVRHHGLGLVGDGATVNVTTMVEMINEVRTPAYRAALARMREAFRAQIECSAGVDFLRAMASLRRLDRDAAALTVPNPPNSPRRTGG
jgi:UDP:flavonoid glycosyltransferase YjiC (YdhE family)